MSNVATINSEANPSDVAQTSFNNFDTNLVQRPDPDALENSADNLMEMPFEKIGFDITGDGPNVLLETAMALLGLSVRLRGLSHLDDITGMHNRLRNEIDTFQRALEASDYDPATVLAARYVICAVIDEAVLSQQWGAESTWSEHPMLSVFHNETWGGEKVFSIIDRVLDEPHRFLDLLEFLYYCLALGFEGKYHVMHNGQSKLDALMKTVHAVLVKNRGEAPARAVVPEPNIIDTREKMRIRFPVWMVFVVLGVVLFATHTYFDQKLTQHITGIGDEIQGILAQDTEGLE